MKKSKLKNHLLIFNFDFFILPYKIAYFFSSLLLMVILNVSCPLK